MRQSRVAKYSRCGLCCCDRGPGKYKIKLKPSKSKRTKGYKVHLEAVFNYVERQPVGEYLRFHDLVSDLNIDAGYAMTCLKMLKTKGVKIRILKKGWPHDSRREHWGYYKPGDVATARKIMDDFESGWGSGYRAILYKKY
jgi:hypothetical protein